MAFFEATWFGVRAWIILYLIFSILGFVGVLGYVFREWVKKKAYSLKDPEKLVKVVVHYSGNMYRVFWRLIPEAGLFEIDGKAYKYEDEKIRKDNDFFIQTSGNKDRTPTRIKVEDKVYDFEETCKIKNRWEQFPEIHYIYGNPKPLDFNIKAQNLDFSPKELQQFKDNNLFVQLLTMDNMKMQNILLIGIMFINMIMTGVILAKMMGWIE